MWIGGFAAVGVGVALAGSALAQAVTEEVVVVARFQGKQLRSLSVPVSYRDLDLTTASGRTTLQQRVRATAKDSCRRLGEANLGGTAAMASCEDGAVNGAAEQERMAFAKATPRTPR